MLSIRKCNGKDEEFKALTKLLDEHLSNLNGKELQEERYAKFNTTDDIVNAYVIYVDGKAVGCGAYKYYNETTSELKRIYVLEKFRHQGIASMLISRIELDAYDEGYSKMILESATTLKGAHALYKKIGYKQIDNFEPFVGMDTSYCFEKELSF